MLPSDSIRLSKLLSLVLRHQPETIGVSLDREGWIPIDELLFAMKQHGRVISREELEALVANSDKQRFLIRDNRIRANQGHSLEVDLALKPQVPPEVLFHGTSTRALEQIRALGLRSLNRQFVHLSAAKSTALQVGKRHGQPVVLVVCAQAMHKQGHEFFVSENGVWLTKEVGPQFLSKFS